MNGEYLESCASASYRGTLHDTYESGQCNSKFTDLLNGTLCCAIWAGRNDPVMSPSNIEDTADSLQEVVLKKGEL